MSSATASKSKASHVNPEPTPEVAGIPAESSSRQRGPVEEVIAKRMKQLGKKLQRYRTYATMDVQSLNADQKAALISLPALEGGYKELQDLVREKGPVEEQELIQAAKLREATEAAKAAALAEAGSSTEQYKSSLVEPLSLFLRLHALLHPARSSDHENLTFGRLDLPSNLQDEVQATDVLRVGRMFEDLTAGREGAQAVLDSLVGGSTGQDEENDRVHHLLQLLARPEPTVESATGTPAEGATEDFTATALAESVEAVTAAAPDAVVPAEEQEVLTKAHASAHQPSSGLINFLQEDELVQAEQVDVADGIDATAEEDFEIVPSMEAHQTSGSQPPVETATTTQMPTTTATPGISRTPTAFAPIPTGNWADLDDDDEFTGGAPPTSNQDTSQSTPAATGETTDQPTSVENAAAESSASAGPKATSTRPPRGPKGQRRPNQPRQKQQGRDQQSQQPRQAQQPAPGQKLVDDDGFELKSRRAPQAPARGGTRGLGRGGARGSTGSGGRGGRGRGGAANGRAASGAGEDGQAQSRPKQTQRQQSQSQGASEGQAATKPSIYKSAQPAPPKSAPIH